MIPLRCSGESQVAPVSLLYSFQEKRRGLESVADSVRHEIAYVFGQLCSPHSIPSLLSRLEDSDEDPMVRHEAAEALGGIASDGVEGELS